MKLLLFCGLVMAKYWTTDDECKSRYGLRDSRQRVYSQDVVMDSNGITFIFSCYRSFYRALSTMPELLGHSQLRQEERMTCDPEKGLFVYEHQKHVGICRRGRQRKRQHFDDGAECEGLCVISDKAPVPQSIIGFSSLSRTYTVTEGFVCRDIQAVE